MAIGGEVMFRPSRHNRRSRYNRRHEDAERARTTPNKRGPAAGLGRRAGGAGRSKRRFVFHWPLSTPIGRAMRTA